MLLILVVQTLILDKLLACPAFCEALAKLPSVPNCPEIPVTPSVWVDDFVLTANSGEQLQQQVEQLSAVLGQIKMSFKTKAFHWISTDSLTTLQIHIANRPARKEHFLTILGLSLVSDGSPQHSITTRRAAALSKWFAMSADINLRRLPKDVIERLHNSIFVPSASFGLAAIPMAPSMIQDLSRGSSSHLMRYMKKPTAKDVGQWLHEVRRDLRSKRLVGTLHSPVTYMASDIRAITKFCNTMRGESLSKILSWRDNEWMRSVSRQHRPTQRKGGGHHDFQFIRSDLDYYCFLRRFVA